MDTGKPPTAGLRAHYRQLRSSHHWLNVAMCWTAVVPDSGEAFTLDEIAVRLGGAAPYQLHEPADPSVTASSTNPALLRAGLALIGRRSRSGAA
ncbi:hypothetical protein ABZ912_45520 [Nonomuraea angiospora]|uniref:hypothetical protein n=1 Tax=Nonomuraea angiospora TaxID=46172 RepID=UPI0033FE7206